MLQAMSDDVRSCQDVKANVTHNDTNAPNLQPSAPLPSRYSDILFHKIQLMREKDSRRRES